MKREGGTQREREVMAGYIPWMVGWVMLLMMLEMEEEEEEEERRRMELDREGRGRRKGRGMQNREAEKRRGKEARKRSEKRHKKGKKYAEEFLGQKSPPVGGGVWYSRGYTGNIVVYAMGCIRTIVSIYAGN